MPFFRWSDNVRFAAVFSAADQRSFFEPALNALIDARVATCRSTHRGEYRARFQLCPELELHVLVGDQYVQLGRRIVVDTASGPESGWVPQPFVIPSTGKWLTPPQRGDWPGAGYWPPAESPPHDDRAFLAENLDDIWARAEDTIEWGGSLRRKVEDVRTALAEELCEVCRINRAVRKCYWTNEGGWTVPVRTCGPCCTLTWASANRLMAADPERVRVLIKSWWDPERRETTLSHTYPGVDWGQVPVDEAEETDVFGLQGG